MTTLQEDWAVGQRLERAWRGWIASHPRQTDLPRSYETDEDFLLRLLRSHPALYDLLASLNETIKPDRIDQWPATTDAVLALGLPVADYDRLLDLLSDLTFGPRPGLLHPGALRVFLQKFWARR